MNRNDFLLALADAWTKQHTEGEAAEVVYSGGDVNFVRLKAGIGSKQQTFEVSGTYDAGGIVRQRMGFYVL